MGRMNNFREVRHIPELIYAMLPDEPQLEDGIIYVVDDSPYVEYNCPCGCGSVVMLPTKRHTDGKNGWDYMEQDGESDPFPVCILHRLSLPIPLFYPEEPGGMVPLVKT